MEKILLAIDSRKIDMDALNFACYIAKLTNSRLTGVFLENTQFEKERVLKEVNTLKPVSGATNVLTPELHNRHQQTDSTIQHFKSACEKKFTGYNLHRDRGVPVAEIINESRYADLIIADSTTSFGRKMESRPTTFIRDILKDAECPIIIAPKTFTEIDQLIFTYDGSRSAAFAIKQFTYLFPELDDRKVTVLQANKDGEWTGADKYHLKEWLQNRYSAIGFKALKGDPDEQLFDYLFTQKNAFVVMGAYGRNNLSNIFKPSQADILIQKIPHPIFISHY
jgi:hypothetical protein